MVPTVVALEIWEIVIFSLPLPMNPSSARDDTSTNRNTGNVPRVEMMLKARRLPPRQRPRPRHRLFHVLVRILQKNVMETVMMMKCGMPSGGCVVLPIPFGI